MAAATIAIDHSAWRPRYNPWLVAFTVTLATFMEVLDTSIANIALPHIAGTFGASANESTWVLTSYLVSNGIVLPISAWLATRIGRKRYYMTCVALFAGSSFLCGLAPTLGMLVFFRILQGIGGGGLQPSEQSILADTFSPEQRGMAFSIYAMAVVLAPAIGPTIGGWITDNYSWRWIFYINVPISILSLLMSHRFVEDPPYLRAEQAKKKGATIDYVGLGLVALGVGALQMVMDKGQELDWFGSRWISGGIVLAAVVLTFWVWWEWHHPHPIVELKLLKRRNLSTAMFSMVLLGSVLYGTTVLLPEFLETLMGYPAALAGEAMAAGGFMMMLTMPTSGALTSKMDPRVMLACGYGATALGLYNMAAHINLGMDFWTASNLRMFQIAGLAFIFIPSNVLCYAGVPREMNNQVASMMSFVRNIGGSIGIAVVSTLVTRATQRRQSYMAAHINNGNANFRDMISGMAATLHSQGLSVAEATHQAYERVNMMLQQQAAAVAYKDVISVLAIIVMCLIPTAFIMVKPSNVKRDAPPPH
ncbi:MAG TPA: DHA2 family efflux MFS transporter permease subunit [Candidatus Acidoferrales bacterium]|nr:DHA2 family efflux MFS transporter permease subunit [Candidatus Acidoferrales bacterium]